MVLREAGSLDHPHSARFEQSEPRKHVTLDEEHPEWNAVDGQRQLRDGPALLKQAPRREYAGQDTGQEATDPARTDDVPGDRTKAQVGRPRRRQVLYVQGERERKQRRDPPIQRPVHARWTTVSARVPRRPNLMLETTVPPRY